MATVLRIFKILRGNFFAHTIPCLGNIIAILFLLCIPTAVLAEPVRQTIQKFYRDIASRTELKIPPYTPEVVWITRSDLQRIGCDGQACTVAAALIDGVVYLSVDAVRLDTTLGRSILYHEIVHVMQFWTVGPPADCRERLAYERVAYELQQAYTRRHGIEYHFLGDLARALDCRYPLSLD